MCGIAGVVHADPERKVDPFLVAGMCEALRHRGPDDEGIVVEGRIGLGMRRLAIIDLQTGRQPINNEDGSITVIFNGEIYNFQELRQWLHSRGHQFRTRSDTEVIAHLYEEHGDACIEKLRGMFAIAVWDRRQQRLLLARDRLGVKPLYYRIEDGRLLFGSEIKAILQDRSVPRIVNLDGIDQMLTYGYVASPATCFLGICELPPASTLTYVDGRIHVKRYWDLSFDASGPYDEEMASQQLLSLLRESVRLRMIADVPLGVLLSGGIDSSVVVALMCEMSDQPVKTFSIGFDDPSFSELPYARQIADRYHTEHHELIVKPQVIELLPELIRHHDAPFYDSSAIPTYYVCKMARQYVKVALSGDGGDELLAGYNLYLADKAAKYYRRIPSLIRDFVIAPLVCWIPESNRYFNTGRVLREFTRAASLGPRQRYIRWVSNLKEETRRNLYKAPYLVDRLSDHHADHLASLFDCQPNATALNRMLYVDTNRELASDILVKVDRMSMASSLEVRSPLLDHHLFDFAAKLPDQAKLNGWTTKYLLKKVARKFLPGDLLKRPKHGFSVPLNRWFREDLASFAREILFDPVTRLRGYFHQDIVERIVEDHVAGLTGYGREIWTLLTLELWLRMYIDRFDYTKVVDHHKGTFAL